MLYVAVAMSATLKSRATISSRSTSGFAMRGACLAVRAAAIGQWEYTGAARWKCAYCGTTAGRLTLDHIIPRSKGGESIWENVVIACAPCNLRKGDRSLEQVGMELRTQPRPPAPALFIRLAAPRIPSGWTPYLPGVATA
jgi:hypothetical protein